MKKETEDILMETLKNLRTNDKEIFVKLEDIRVAHTKTHGIVESTKEQTDKHDDLLYGEGDAPGLKGTVDRMVQTEKSRTWWSRTMAGGLVVLCFERVKTYLGW